MLTPQALVDWLHMELDKRNLSQAEASRRAGLSVNAINQIVNGQRPGMRTCAALAELFGVPITEIMRLAGYIDDALPPTAGRVEAARELLAELGQATQSDADFVMDFVRWYLERQKKRDGVQHDLG